MIHRIQSQSHSYRVSDTDRLYLSTVARWQASRVRGQSPSSSSIVGGMFRSVCTRSYITANSARV